MRCGLFLAGSLFFVDSQSSRFPIGDERGASRLHSLIVDRGEVEGKESEGGKEGTMMSRTRIYLIMAGAVAGAIEAGG